MVKWDVCVLVALCTGCANDDSLTELVLSADSNLRLDRVVFEVSAQGVPVHSAEAARTGTGPSFVSVVRDRGTLGPLTVVARGMFQNSELVRRTQVVSFVENESLLVRLDLYARCFSTRCPGNQTCVENGCAPTQLDNLEPWTGDPPRLAGSDGGAAPFAVCGSDLAELASDPRHCGDCAHKCSGMENCTGGTCVRK